MLADNDVRDNKLLLRLLQCDARILDDFGDFGCS